MADMPTNIGTTRKMSFGINGKLNGVEGKTPFLIGVSGGTASGKVFLLFLHYNFCAQELISIQFHDDGDTNRNVVELNIFHAYIC